MTSPAEKLRACRAHIRSLQAAFNACALPADETERVKVILRHLRELDQYVRRYASENSPNFTGKELDQQTHAYKLPTDFAGDAQERAFIEKLFPFWEKLDHACVSELKELMKTHDWFTIPEFGAAASQSAWLIAQHADADPAFQKEVLALLEHLHPTGAVNANDYAYLFDRVAVSYYDESQRKPQLYGTQGDGFPIADPENLNARRAKLGLKPL